MEPSRVLELMAGLEADEQNGDSPGLRLCGACVELLTVSGAGIMLVDDGGHESSLGVSDDATGVVEDLQFTLGEGPGIEAHASGRPALESNLDDPASARWPVFAPAAVDVGMLGAFGFPLRVGAIRLGALDLYRDQPGGLLTGQMTDAFVLADVVTQALLRLQADAVPGEVALRMDHAGPLRAEVHQASGMISGQLDISLGDALVRLRAHAYAEGRPVDDVARDVVTRRLRFA